MIRIIRLNFSKKSLFKKGMPLTDEEEHFVALEIKDFLEGHDIDPMIMTGGEEDE